MKRRTVSLSEQALATLERLAREGGTNVPCVVEAAAKVVEDGGQAAQDIQAHLVRDRRGGPRPGSGRRTRNIGESQ